MRTTLNFRGRGKTKKTAPDIYEWTLHIEFERDRLIGLGATLGGDGQKIKNYFSSFRDFFGKTRCCHILGLRMFYKPIKFNQNRWSYFRENTFFNFFLM